MLSYCIRLTRGLELAYWLLQADKAEFGGTLYPLRCWGRFWISSLCILSLPLEKELMLMNPLCSGAVADWMRVGFTGSYNFSAEWHPRDSALNSIIQQFLQSAGVSSILEPLGIGREMGINPISNRGSWYWDITCTVTYAENNIYSWAVSDGHAARKAETQKCLK